MEVFIVLGILFIGYKLDKISNSLVEISERIDDIRGSVMPPRKNHLEYQGDGSDLDLE